MDRKPGKHCNLRVNEAIRRWDEAIPLGNGLMGCLIWGPADGLRFSLDRGDLWDNSGRLERSDPGFSYENMVRLAHQGDTEELRRLFLEPMLRPVPTKIPAGKLILHIPGGSISSELLLDRAEAVIRIGQGDGGAVVLRSFLHAGEPVGLIKINRLLNDCDIEVVFPPFRRPGEAVDFEVSRFGPHPLRLLQYEPVQTGNQNGLKWFIQKIDDTCSYGIFMLTVEKDGSTEIAYTVAATPDGDQWQAQAVKQLRTCLQAGYETVLAAHTTWWNDYWNSSAISIPEPLFEKQWYLSNYFFACCSRKDSPPMPLQGVWTADDGNLAPWKGEYALDLNLQFSYTHYLKANHITEGESVIDWLWALRPAARAFARDFFRGEGICLPGSVSLQGDPLGGWPMYAFSPTNQIWNCQLFERHYRYTGDLDFLRGKAYPYLSETAQFILGLLEKNSQGYFVLPVSTSPEIHDDSPAAWLTPNSNYDLSLLIYLFTQLKKFAIELDNGEAGIWQKVLDGLPELAIDAQGVLMLSPDERLTESHRHHSHLMAIYPLRLLDPASKDHKRIIDASIRNLVGLGKAMWVGFSFSWMAELYAIQGNGEGAAFHLRLLWETLYSPNGFHLNGDYRQMGLTVFDYRPFTIETNLSALDALQEMLLRSEDGMIEVFPAVPDAWKTNVSFEDFRGEAGILISAWMKNRAVERIVLKPAQNGEIRLVCPGGWNSVTADEPCDSRKADSRFILRLEKGRTYRLTPHSGAAEKT